MGGRTLIDIESIRRLTPDEYQALPAKSKNALHDALNGVYDLAPLTVQREAKRLGIPVHCVFYPDGIKAPA